MKNKMKSILEALSVALIPMLATYSLWAGMEIKELKNQEPVVVVKEVIKEVEVQIPCDLEHVVAEPVIAQTRTVYQDINTNYQVFKPSGLTEEELYLALGNGSRSGLHRIVPAVKDAEETYGVNSIYLLSKIGLESGWGKYYSGQNNIGGWKPNGRWANFDSEYECIMTIAEGLSTSFRETHGDTLGGVSQRYCTDSGYTDLLLQIMGELQYNLSKGGVQ